MNLLLISEASIIEHIFTLVCKRLEINLTIQKIHSLNADYDLIIVDQTFIDDKFNSLKPHTRKLGAISSEELSFDKSKDFVIPRPFLPTQLEAILIEQKQILKDEDEYEDEKSRLVATTPYVEPIVQTQPIVHDDNDDSVIIVPIVDYVETALDQEVLRNSKNIEPVIGEYDEEDESIVSLNAMNLGGVLDSNELNKIADILREDTIQNEINLEKNDWQDINSIIDDALAEVREYEFDLKQQQVQSVKPYELILSNFNINELRPLLEKLDQTIIDRISAGEIVDVKISLKGK